jgi:acyl-CoA thioesterase-1
MRVSPAGAAFVLVALSGACTAPEVPPATNCDVVIVGTSLTAGYGLEQPERDAWPAVFAGRAGGRVVVDARGWSGSTAADWEPVVAAELRTRPAASWVILELGANEMLRGVNPDAFRREYRSVIDSIRLVWPEVRLALVRVAPGVGSLAGRAGQRAGAIAGEVSAVAKELGIPVVPDLLRGVRFTSALNQDDGVHPNPAGAMVAATNAEEVLLPWLEAGGCR